jgi:hypothetical protein
MALILLSTDKENVSRSSSEASVGNLESVCAHVMKIEMFTIQELLLPIV